MAGICSAHIENDPAVARAKAAGEFKCKCGFVYYLTTDTCPLCNRVKKGHKL